MMSEVDTTYRSGEKDKIKKTLSIGEAKLAAFQKITPLLSAQKRKELMEAYSSASHNSRRKKKQIKTKPTVAQTTKENLPNTTHNRKSRPCKCYQV